LAVLVSVVLGIQLLALTASMSSNDDVNAVAVSASPVGGTFNTAPDVFIETHYYVDSVDVSDMNGDGANDVLVGGWDSLGGGIEIHLQTVPGAYSEVPDVQIQMAPKNPNVVTSTYVDAMDANGDGTEDLAVVGWWTAAFRGAIYTQTATHSFEFSTNLSPSNPRQIETGDVNGDGLTDLVVGDSSNIGIFLQNSSTGFNLYPDEMICLCDAWPYYLIEDFTIADLNEDGRLDVMMSYEMREGDPYLGSHITGFRVAAFYQPLDGWSQYVWQDRPVTQPDVVLVDLPGDSVVYCAGMGVGDLNGDGHDDIATLVGNYYTNASINIFPFDATILGISTVACQTFTVGPVMIGNFPHHFDDLNQDGRDDLLVGYPVSIYYQMADGTISQTPGLQTNNLSNRGLIVADMDGDGDKDIVGADAKSVNIWFDHTPPPSPGTHEVLKGAQGPRASAVTWEYAPSDYGTWNGDILNNGLRSLSVDIYDVTTGIPDQIMHHKIRFAANNAYPYGEASTSCVEMSPMHRYMITVTPNGPLGSSCVVEDMFLRPPPISSITKSSITNGVKFTFGPINMDTPWSDVTILLQDHFGNTASWSPLTTDLDGGMTVRKSFAVVALGSIPSVWCNITDLAGNGYWNQGDFVTFTTGSTSTFSPAVTYTVTIMHDPSASEICHASFNG
jgi:hypothetical protein